MSALSDIVARASEVVASTGQGWTALAGPVSDAAAAQGERHHEVRIVGGPVVLPDFGREAEQTLQQDLHIVLYRILAGDPQEEEVALLDEALEVATALELATGWPSGLQYVMVVERGGVERGVDAEAPESPWARTRITMRAVYTAAFA